MKRVLIFILIGLCCIGRLDAAITNAGVIGNSGEHGDSLVRFAEKPARGIGVVYDSYGKLWDRAGDGLLNSYALDGRMLGQFEIPKSQHRNDQMTIVGDILVLQINDELYSLDVNAVSGTKITPLNIKSSFISFGTTDGRFAFVNEEDKICLMNPITGECSLAVKAPVKSIRAIELTEDGVIYVFDNKVYRFVGGELDEEWSRPTIGERPQLIDDSWYAHSWHGTIKKFDKDLQASPGVILGGASGSFIGHLAQNSELINGRGMAKINDNLYAVSGLTGVIHLMEWNPQTEKMTIIRRIGAVMDARGIGLDSKGRLWAITGSWEWNDKPDSPIRFSVNPPDNPGISQVIMKEDDVMIATGFMWGKPTLFVGNFDKEIKSYRMAKGFDLRKGGIGSALYRQNDKLKLLVVNSKGKAQAFQLTSAGRFKANLGEVELKTTHECLKWTTFAMKGPNLIAAADGYIIEFEADGNDWKEIGRWNSWGISEHEKFGKEIYITADDGLIWVADTERHRVLCFDLAAKMLLDSFGCTDVAGSDMHTLDSPKTIISRGKTKAVVFDSCNQRFIKLTRK